MLVESIARHNSRILVHGIVCPIMRPQSSTFKVLEVCHACTICRIQEHWLQAEVTMPYTGSQMLHITAAVSRIH